MNLDIVHIMPKIKPNIRENKKIDEQWKWVNI